MLPVPLLRKSQIESNGKMRSYSIARCYPLHHRPESIIGSQINMLFPINVIQTAFNVVERSFVMVSLGAPGAIGGKRVVWYIYSALCCLMVSAKKKHGYVLHDVAFANASTGAAFLYHNGDEGEGKCDAGKYMETQAVSFACIVCVCVLGENPFGKSS